MTDHHTSGSVAHFGHRAFNEQFLPQAKTAPHPDIVTGPWLSNEAMANLPGIRREFDRNRDPTIAAQLKDQERTEVQRRGDQTGRSSSMIKQDQLKANLKPPEITRRAVDNQQFKSRWLSEQRDAAMAQSHQSQQHDHQLPLVKQQYKSFER